MLDDPVLVDTPAQYLFLVGGFSESEVLRKAVKDEFSSQLQVISPQVQAVAHVKKCLFKISISSTALLVGHIARRRTLWIGYQRH